MAETLIIDVPMVTTKPFAVRQPAECKAVVIWIDWYAYHIARFAGLTRHPDLAGRVVGIELVGGMGVHAGLNFRASIPAEMPVHTLMPGQNWNQAGKWKLAFALWRQLTSLNPSVVLIPGYYTVPALVAALWAKLKRRTSVLMTESTAHDHSRRWWREGIKKLLLRNLFDWAVSGGKPHQRYLRNLGFPAQRIAGFYDVVDNSFFHERCNALRSAQRGADHGLPAQYFLYVGRMSSEKNVDGLLDAYLRYREVGGEWALVYVGDGRCLTDIRAQAASSNYASDIYFAGLKPTFELPLYYAFASVFVLPSTTEPWGLVVNEAMAARLPVIVSKRCGCVEDLVREGENGYSFDPSDPEALFDSMLKISQMDLELLRNMGERSGEIVSLFSPEKWASEIARIASA